MAHHPRFPALSSQYGEMAGTVGAAPGSAAQPSAMQELQLVCVAPSAGGRMGTQVKKLPGQGMRSQHVHCRCFWPPHACLQLG